MTYLRALPGHAPLPSFAVLFFCLLSAATTATRAQELTAGQGVHFPSTGARIPGDQFLYDCGFELLDFNGDGKLDVFLPNTSMMSFAAHLNEGSSTDSILNNL